MENEKLKIGTPVYVIEPKVSAYKIKQGVIHTVPNFESQAYRVQFNDAAQTITTYYRSELYLSKDDAQAIRVEIINNEIRTNQRIIETYNDVIASLQANTERLKKLLEDDKM